MHIDFNSRLIERSPIKLCLKIFEFLVQRLVKALPQDFLKRVIFLLPPNFVAKAIRSFDSLKIYNVSIIGQKFLIESGPRDDHYLDLEKDGLRDWEHEVLAYWANAVKNAEVAVDVGAYLGIYSVFAAKIGCKRVVAIEPNSKSFLQLKKNVQINSLGNSVETYQYAIGNESGIASIITPANRPFSSGTQIINSPTDRNLKKWKIESQVEMITLDTLLIHSTARISAIKIDVEGYEFFILQGSKKILQESKPVILIEILSKEQKVRIDNYLSKFGYDRGIGIDSREIITNYLYKIS